MSGPAPKPTALKQLAGNPGKRPLNAAEPAFKPEVPSCPRHLSGIARREWKRIARRLANAGVLTQVDRAALAAYCQAYGHWVDAERVIAKAGMTDETPNGLTIQSAYMQIANKSMALMLKFAQEFGMTPAARTRVHAEKEEKEMSLADILFEGVGGGD